MDENLAALHLLFSEPLPGSALCERIANALHGLETLTVLRDGVTGQRVTAPRAMEHYSRILRLLLNIVPQLSDSIDDPHIAGRFVALYSLMQGKELVGQERALGAIGFTEGFFDDETRQRLVDRIDVSRPAFEVFISIALQTCRETFTLNCQPGLETEKLRREACTRQPPADNGDTALKWFALQTARLEHLRTLEEVAIADLMTAVEERRYSENLHVDDEYGDIWRDFRMNHCCR